MTGSILPYDLTVESLTDPVGIDTPEPRLSWKSKAVQQNAYHLKQSAWQIVTASSKENLDLGVYDLWDSGKVNSSDSLFISYKGKKLETSQYCYWKVRVWDQNGNVSRWSETGRWGMAIMDPADWSASWIGMPETLRPNVDLSDAHWIGCSKKEAKTTYLRKTFDLNISKEDLEKKEIYALLRYAGNQKFEMFLNGEPIGFSIGIICNPNLLRTIDISERLVPGKNILAIFLKNRNSPDPLAFLGKLEIGKIDKTEIPEQKRTLSYRGVPETPFQIIRTDSTWTASETAGKDWNTLQLKGIWPNATVLFEPDNGPWGNVRRTDEKESPLFQKKFTLKKKVNRAILHICGLGFYEASLNGKRIGDKRLDPAPTNFDKTVLYSSYELTEELNEGVGCEQDFRVQLGHGWYDVRAIVTWNFDAAPWKNFPRLIAQLELVYDDGSKEKILSDTNWSALRSPFIFDCIRQGEIFDANRKPDLLGQAVVVPAPKGKMKAQMMPPAKITEVFHPVTVQKIDDNTQVADLGRNIAGWCAITIRNSQKGDVIRFRYSERIDQNGKIERKTLEEHFMEGSPAILSG
ncbi:MAG: family 78 glycoside hydrolase catalytic domain, partial [Planctomycetia bacterium]|nr:family 78 glycoside hydrolase catalytic domain [Planctomycetia bacterium]